MTAEELEQFCVPQLARFKIPIAIHFVPELPRNASGKILRRQLGNVHN